jgi:putative transcriptional regulator
MSWCSEGRTVVTSDTDMGQLVRELRERLGLTQEKFAARVGVTFPTINRWENNRAKPSPLAVKQIEDLLRDLGDEGQDLLRRYLARKGA